MKIACPLACTEQTMLRLQVKYPLIAAAVVKISS
jgi:hypothetical protein